MKTINLKVGDKVKFKDIYPENLLKIFSIDYKEQKVWFSDGSFVYSHNLCLLNILVSVNGEDVTNCNITIEPEPEEEFEPITEDNIFQVLEYNEFSLRYADVFIKENFTFKFHIVTKNYSFEYCCFKNKIECFDFVISKDLKKVLRFMQEFIELKPLPKKPTFDARQYLLENGFKEIHSHELYYGDINDSILKIAFTTGYDEFTLKPHSYYSNYHLANFDSLKLVVEAAKLLETLQ